MALVCRIKQSKLKALSNQLKRCYFQIHGPCSANHAASRSRIGVFYQPNRALQKSQLELCNTVRFFAAPVQVKPKHEERDPSGPRLNEQITADILRLVTDEGHKVVSRREALERAKRLKLDLVEVQRTAKPPVCKIMDYNKERYKQQMKEKDRAKIKSEGILRSDSKEVRFTGKIEQKDLQMKADTVKRMMERGYRVKCLAMGTEDQDLNGLLSRLSALIEDVAIVERGPEKEKKGAHIIVRHIKFGTTKRGLGKKAADVLGAKSADALSSPPVKASTSNQTPDEQADVPISPTSTWSIGDDDHDFEEAFDFCDDVKSDANNSMDGPIETTPERTTFGANSFSDSLHRRPVLDSVEADTIMSSQSDDPVGTANRFISEPVNTFNPRKSVDSGLPGPKDSKRLDHTSRNREMQPHLNVSRPTWGPKQVESDASSFKNLRPPANDVPKQNPSARPAPSSLPTRFGIFSTLKANDTPAPPEDGVQAEANMYKNENPNYETNRGPGRVSANPNSSTSNSDGSQRQGSSRGGQGSWGIFSREGSNLNSGWTSESQAKSQR